MGSGKAARTRRVVYQYRFARHKRDDGRRAKRAQTAAPWK
jgi:hypothetical protein